MQSQFHPAAFHQIYRPKPSRVPGWLRLVLRWL